MVDAVVSFCVQKLGEQITQEIQLLSGVRDDVAWIRDELQSMKSFLLDADRRRDREAGVEDWVTQVRRLVFRAEDAVDEFMIQADMRRRLKNRFMGHLLFHACFLKSTIARHQFAAEMQIIRSHVKDIDDRRRRYEFQTLPREGMSSHSAYGAQNNPGVAASWVEEADIVGLEKDAMKLQHWLLEADETPQRTIISIVGAGGLGKTTLAKKAYKDIQIHFQSHAWVFVSQTFQTKDILKKMLKSFFESGKEPPPNGIETMEEAELQRTIFEYLRGKRYALVLDDIWDARVWEDVKYALPREGSNRIVFTTRIESIASPVDERTQIHELQPLANDLAWKLFCRKAFRNESPCGACPEHLVEVAKAMIKKCHGLPLAIVAIGGLMSKKGTNPSEWNEVLGNLGWELNHNEDLARLNNVLLTSYNYLPSHLKHCFLYCAMFPEDAEIPRRELIRMWVAEGFVEERPAKTPEEVANDCFVQLIERNMLIPANQVYVWRTEVCQMHDIMRDIAIYMFKKEEFAKIATNHGKDGEEKQHRRLSIQSKVVDIPKSSAPSNPRTLLLLGEDEFPSSVLCRMLSDFKLLRVLDLGGSKIVDLPKEIGRLVHLRYLNLCGTGIEMLPKSLQRLQNLQTLDARGCNLKCIPDYIIKLVQLRHLLVYSYPTRPKMPRGISNLRSLQTLSSVLIDDELLRELGGLKEMKELAVTGVRKEHCTQLCDSISQLQRLRSLEIKAASDENEVLRLQSLQQPPQYLEEVCLDGIMEELPQWIGSLSCVRQILLDGTKLVDDPFPTLGLLPNLLILGLDNGYVGKQIGLSRGGFPKLRTLDIAEMQVLEELSEVEEGTLQSLQILDIDSCPKLKMLPDGLQHIVSMKELRLWDMSDEFIDRIKSGGEDHFKVQHIPIITIDMRLMANG